MTRDGSLKRLGMGESFLVDLEGHKIVTVRLPTDVASEISGEALISRGLSGKLKSKLRLTPEAETWLVVTSVDNPLLERLDKFEGLLVEQLAHATGGAVTKSNLAVSVAVPLSEEGQFYDEPEPSWNKRPHTRTGTI